LERVTNRRKADYVVMMVMMMMMMMVMVMDTK
jgi:hypothetical protein